MRAPFWVRWSRVARRTEPITVMRRTFPACRGFTRAASFTSPISFSSTYLAGTARRNRHGLKAHSRSVSASQQDDDQHDDQDHDDGAHTDVHGVVVPMRCIKRTTFIASPDLAHRIVVTHRNNRRLSHVSAAVIAPVLVRRLSVRVSVTSPTTEESRWTRTQGPRPAPKASSKT